MEILQKTPATPVGAVLFDFDGTISTLRFGWETVMREMMLSMLSAGRAPDETLRRHVDEYIDASTGIQTIFQMKWLAAQVKAGPAAGLPDDPWWYKDEYNRRLMAAIAGRIDDVESGRVAPEQYRIAGAADFLRALQRLGVPCYVASGTDDADVRHEAHVLGVDGFFAGIAGAPERVEGCAKEAALRMLAEQSGLAGARIAVIGDGKVEISLARSLGARALGLATDEAARRGVNEKKRERLIRAGADAVAGDFLDKAGLLSWLGLKEA